MSDTLEDRHARYLARIEDPVLRAAENARLQTERDSLQVLQKGERLETYDEAAERLGIPLTVSAIIANGATRRSLEDMELVQWLT